MFISIIFVTSHIKIWDFYYLLNIRISKNSRRILRVIQSRSDVFHAGAVFYSFSLIIVSPKGILLITQIIYFKIWVGCDSLGYEVEDYRFTCFSDNIWTVFCSSHVEDSVIVVISTSTTLI